VTKIAIISDIHGNKTALEAVLKDIRLRKIERIFCLGDLTSFSRGLPPLEVLSHFSAGVQTSAEIEELSLRTPRPVATTE